MKKKEKKKTGKNRKKKIKATCCSPMFRYVQRIIEVAGWKFSGKCNRKRGYNCECRIACPDQYFFVVPDRGSWQSRGESNRWKYVCDDKAIDKLYLVRLKKNYSMYADLKIVLGTFFVFLNFFFLFCNNGTIKIKQKGESIYSWF